VSTSKGTSRGADQHENILPSKLVLLFGEKVTRRAHVQFYIISRCTMSKPRGVRFTLARAASLDIELQMERIIERKQSKEAPS
jgi:hypothetical protein